MTSHTDTTDTTGTTNTTVASGTTGTTAGMGPRGANDPGDTGSWELHRRFLLRVAGLPVEAVAGLRDEPARDWAVRVLDAEAELASLAVALDEPLTALVTGVEDPRRRREVLAVRRDVFNGRLPRDPQAVRTVAEYADAANVPGGASGNDSEAAGENAHTTGELLLGWLKWRTALAALEDEGGPLLADGLARTRAALRTAAGEERLRHGLVLASPTLDAQLDAFIADPAPVPDKRARKKERSLLAYLYRTACKTSPFSTFTGVADGRFTDDAGPECGAGGPWTSHPRLNVVVLARLAELIAADPERRAALPVAVSAGWELDEDRVRYVRRSVTAGDDNAAVSFDAAHDRLFFLRRHGILERMLGLFAGGASLRYGELREWLAAETGAPPEEAARYPATLLDLGILRMTGLETDVHAPDPLRAFQDALRALDRDWADATALRLDAAAACVRDYPAAGAAERRALLRRLRAELLTVQVELGAEDPSLPQTLLYEDVSAQPVTADLDRWTDLAAAPLRALDRMLPAFDVALPQRLVLKGFFLARYGRGGRCDDLLRLVHDFHEDVFTQYLQFTSLKSPYLEDGSHAPEENWLGMPEVTALDRARAAFTGRMRGLWAAHPEGAAELALDEETVTAVAAELAPLGSPFAPHSHFVQLADRVGDPLVVLNNSYGGLSFPFTRFTHCFDGPARPAAPTAETLAAGPADATEGDATEGDPGATAMTDGLREALRAWQPPGAVFAEVTAGSATTNLNLHGRLTDHEIVCPGESSTAPPEARLDLDDLYAEHDEAADRLVLRSRRLGREVVPLYLGYLVPMVLPEVPRTLLLFSPTSRSRPDAWRGVPEAPAVDGVTTRPRVRYRSLVLHRRRWTAAPGALPVREPGTGEAASFLAWQRWRRRHGLPERVFATVRAAESGDGAAAAFGGGVKPQYVDFASPLSLLALEGLLAAGPARTVFEEMLPGQDALHVRSPRGRHVAELALEIVPTAPREPADQAAAGPERHGRQDPRA
ncbi:Lantibiotic dehydratase, C terminus [Actinacidiphila rubida]|uniref:Lantibiotic dehydratase, C terminus n=1 Tax=Actinacidiphila rubida TaxID=310780 RepID=A0A1H8RDP8_9ACTN|nr:lantibiotic dehydratase [Actinacidiphila rubida]SEO64629.1 Lantibiotic dehydratase, C terminus [Actinacidiphila rubida]